MFCPLKFNDKTIDQFGNVGGVRSLDEERQEFCQCEGDNCMWYFKEQEACAILALAEQDLVELRARRR